MIEKYCIYGIGGIYACSFISFNLFTMNFLRKDYKFSDMQCNIGNTFFFTLFTSPLIGYFVHKQLKQN